MEKLLLRLTFSACVVIGAIVLNSYSSGGFTSDLTGSPLSSSTCQNSCHNSYSLNSGSGNVSMSVPTSYYPGSSYTVSLTVSQSSPSPARYGFMAGVLRDDNSNGGSFTAGTGSSTTTISSRSYIRHNSTYNSSGTWSFTWTAPSYADTISFYYVGNAANGASGNNGDYIYTGSTTIYPITQMTATIDTSHVTCDGNCDGSISLSNVSGGQGGPYSYTWSNNDTTASISGLCAGTYTVTIEDAGGNEEEIEVIIDAPDPIVSNFNVTPTSCASGNGEVSVQINGGVPPYSYSWSNGSMDSALTNVFVGWYTLTLTDANGCELIDSVEVVSSGSGLVASLSTEDEHCGQSDGYIVLSMIVGNAPYTYAWSNGSTSNVATGLSNGVYTVTVTDSAGCTETFTDTIHERQAVIDVNASLVSDVSCFGGADGSINPVVGEGVPPFSFTWSNGSTTASLTNVAAGSYSLTISDSAGCTDSASFEVHEPAGLVVTAAPDSSNEGFCDGSVMLSVSGGVPPYSFDWSHDATLNDSLATDLCAGSYTVTVTDLNGCISIQTSSVGTVTGLGDPAVVGLVIYPNPTAGRLYLRNAPTSIDQVQLVDVTGRVVREWSSLSDPLLDVKDVPSGRYSLLVRSLEGFVVKPIMISR